MLVGAGQKRFLSGLEEIQQGMAAGLFPRGPFARRLRTRVHCLGRSGDGTGAAQRAVGGRKSAFR